MSTTEGKGQQEEAIEIRKSIVIDASPEVVFQAMTDPNELTNWFPAFVYNYGTCFSFLK